MNKINKLVTTSFSKQFSNEWMTESNQKKIKKILKNKREKPEPEEGKVKKYTPYILFCMDQRPLIKKDYPDYSAKEITAKLGESWNNYKLDNPEFLEKNYGYVKKI